MIHIGMHLLIFCAETTEKWKIVTDKHMNSSNETIMIKIKKDECIFRSNP